MKKFREFLYGKEKVEVEEGTVSIPRSMYSGYSILTEVVLPKGLREIGDRAFYRCSSLVKIELPDSVVVIGKEAFSECVKLAYVRFPKELDKVGDYAFDNCRSLKEIECPNVKEVGFRVFTGDDLIPGYFHSSFYLTSVTIPEHLLVIEGRVEIDGSEVLSVILPRFINEEEKAQHVVLYGNRPPYRIPKQQSKLEEGDSQDVSLNGDTPIPSGKVIWKRRSWNNMPSVKKVVMYNGVKSVPRDAFKGCFLTVVHFPPSMNYIGDSAFQNSKQLSEVVFAKTDREITIDKLAFYGCNSLKRLVFLGNNKKITIGDEAFKTCRSFETIEFRGTPKELVLGDGAFRFSGPRRRGGFVMTSPRDTRVIISNYAFDDSNIYSVNMPGLVSIGQCAFRDCDYLREILLPEGLRYIGGYAFIACKLLPGVNIPEGVREIGDGAFSRCPLFTSIVLPFSLLKMGNAVFEYCEQLRHVTVPVHIDLYHAGLKRGTTILRRGRRIMAKMPECVLEKTGMSPRLYAVDVAWTKMLLLCNQRNGSLDRPKLPYLSMLPMYALLSFIFDDQGGEEKLKACNYRVLESRKIINGRKVAHSNLRIAVKRGARDFVSGAKYFRRIFRNALED